MISKNVKELRAFSYQFETEPEETEVEEPEESSELPNSNLTVNPAIYVVLDKKLEKQLRETNMFG